MKLKFNLALLLFVVITAQLNAFQKEYTVDDFKSIKIGVKSEVEIIKGDYQVSIDANEEDLEDIDVRVKNGVLRIDTDRNRGKGKREDIVITIRVPELENISVAGSSKVYSKDKFSAEDMKISVAGSGDIELDIDCKNLKLSIAGSGKMNLRGKAQTVDIGISGSGKILSSDLESDNIEISISGSGKCEVNAKESIDAKVAGSGKVYYKGDPSRVNLSSAGSGKISKM